MENYPTLTKMGIDNPKQISRYTLTQVDDADHLRIIYKRNKKSLLPVSRRYVFGRSNKAEIYDSGKQATRPVKEVSPLLVQALEELESVVKANQTDKANVTDLLAEINRLEVDLNATLASVRSIVEKVGN